MLFIYPNIFQPTILKMENIIGYVVPLWYAFFLRARVMYQTFCALCVYAQHIRAMHTRNTRTHA